MTKSHDTLAYRLSQILIKLNNGESFTIIELADEFNVNVRTIQRDIKERLSYIPIQKNGDYYSMESYALGKLNFEDIKNFATLSGIKSLYPLLSNEFITDILNAKLNKAYLIKNQGFEDTSHSQKAWFEQLSAAVVTQRPVSFNYTDKLREVDPYKLINNNGIWYLLADEKGKLKNFTFSKIKQFDCKDDTKCFTPKKEFLEQIAKNDTNWFSKENIEVTLQINNKAKEYLLRKEILPNKKIVEQNDEYFTISTNVSYDDEILRLVKYWIPYIKIVSPQYLKEKLNEILKDYLSLD
jgi:predicted DNA-binding transcriptional regulator YafY